MARNRIYVLGVALVLILAGGSWAVNNWQRRPVEQALVSAVKRNDTSMVRLLLLKGANPNTKDEAHLSLATWALLANHADIGELLLSRGAQVDADFCLQDAVDNNRLDQVELLLQHGAHANLVKPAGGAPLLPMCATLGAPVMRTLLNQGIPVNAADGQGATALMKAAAQTDAASVDLLLQYGANPKLKDMEGNTALHQACQSMNGQNQADELKVIDSLLAHGADPTARNNKGAWPLNLINQPGYNVPPKEVDAALIALGTRASDPDVRSASLTGTLWYAIRAHHPAAVAALLDARADPNLKDEDEGLPLVAAVREFAHYGTTDARDVLLALLKHGADPDRSGSDGMSARKLVEARCKTEPAGRQRERFETLLKAMVRSTAVHPAK